MEVNNDVTSRLPTEAPSLISIAYHAIFSDETRGVAEQDANLAIVWRQKNHALPQ